MREVEVHKQELEHTLSDLKGELEDLRVREKSLQAEGSARESASEIKQAMEEEMEERETRHILRVQKLQAEILGKETEISTITK